MCRHEGPVWQGSGSFKNSSGSGSSEEVAPEGAEAVLKKTSCVDVEQDMEQYI